MATSLLSKMSSLSIHGMSQPLFSRPTRLPVKASSLRVEIKQTRSWDFRGFPMLKTRAPFIVQPIAGRECPFTGKKTNKANKVSFSKKRTRKYQKVNLQTKKVWWEAGKRMVKLRLSTKALRTIAKKGLDAMAKEAGIDLRKC
eukprot:TRINITY_DN773_c0_g1_i1.p1 TRINITY_DN773_c0_g1~~TRINITY_DN773_c0_g1_i1.p1  ORF type:complete len:143 (+),score=17.05 TRINITY_DN773_c0_g1_i1:140-568(+)